MRRSTVPAVLLALTLAACAGDAPTAPPADASASDGALASRQAAPQRPMKGSCAATYAEPPVFIPPIVHHVSVGTCQLTHLGRASIRTVGQINVITGVQEAQITYTAANGDQLHATSIGTGTPSGPSTIHFVGVTTITGGTGRFANATGVMDAEGTVNPNTGDATFSYDGWIAY